MALASPPRPTEVHTNTDKLSVCVKPNFAYVNTSGQRARKDKDWVLHVAWGPGGRVPAGSANFGDQSRAREAIELLAQKMKWDTTG